MQDMQVSVDFDHTLVQAQMLSTPCFPGRLQGIYLTLGSAAVHLY